MFARTPIAKEFRKWVLDVLDKEVATTPIVKPAKQTSIRRYYVEVKIHDNLFGGCITLPAKTDSFNSLITGLAGDLGFSITGMVAIAGSMEKLISRAQADR
ncbi:hypothetical protein I2492_15590 [Budviciaceae bacterium CWB-B4]|uniref:Bro-N domain-containing protein n=1 Tax=Limnobaculum xujianqingii TaxID=2738837 RepID=A0A9D7AKS0_9GAMM|nr:hypothetical protein [Limnobaculum xujianqingii]MBK5074590.1 hypothetical protein [Limnobaculum xujianqingii]MBK5177744.1 hypothetical protein [Limnobaculum xujianqingii]